MQFFSAVVTNRTETPSGFVGFGINSAPTSSSSSCALCQQSLDKYLYIQKVFTFGSLAQSLCVRSISPFPPRTRSEPLMEPKRRSQRFDLWEVFSGVGPTPRKERLNFPYGYVRLDLLPVSGLADGSSHTAAVNKSTATNRSFQQDVFLPLSPPVIVSNKAARALVLPAENSFSRTVL